MNNIHKRDNELWYNEWIKMNQEWMHMGVKRKQLELLEIKNSCWDKKTQYIE